MIVGFVAETCRVGQGASCCRYVTMGAGGWACGKLDPALREAIDARHLTMKAQGNNCEGNPNLEAESKLNS